MTGDQKITSYKKTSVALQYDHAGAPMVTASGEGAIASEIINRAKEAGVPIIEDAKLAFLLSTVPLGDEIPPELYRAIAEILVFVLRLEASLVAKS